MTNMFSSEVAPSGSFPVNALLYRDVDEAQELYDSNAGRPAGTETNSFAAPAQEIERLIEAARTEAKLETEQKIRNELRGQIETESKKITQAIAEFQKERRSYFHRVESEIVHLALGIAAKILHRESQVDTMLVASLVRLAIDKLHDGSTVSVRVHSCQIENWKCHLVDHFNQSVHVIADDALGPAGCVLETDLGSADFSIEGQLQEIEKGFFDLLAQRPPIR
jgi:flagellar assembly protein FliH